MVIDLKYPITKGERTLTSIVLPDKILVRHIMSGDNYAVGTVEREIKILSSMTGESELILREMDARDWVVVQAKVRTLLLGEFEEADEDSDNKKKEKRKP